MSISRRNVPPPIIITPTSADDRVIVLSSVETNMDNGNSNSSRGTSVGVVAYDGSEHGGGTRTMTLEESVAAEAASMRLQSNATSSGMSNWVENDRYGRRRLAGAFSSSMVDIASGLRSPTRHHRRVLSVVKPEVKETLNASLMRDGDTQIINDQYVIQEEAGRGSFGAVYRAIDKVTNEVYAIKEVSKHRLRRHRGNAILRQRGRMGSPGLSPRPGGSLLQMLNRKPEDPLDLIRHEIAILKKLDHVNVANLYEVLDNPGGDSLYMVLEWCSRGVIMKLDLDGQVEPYDEEQCRLYFRDLTLGIEYLHSQGVVHRDIKPDNLLLTSDNVLKIVDFGVSEFFERDNDAMSKQAGSPAFMAPELNAVPRVDYSGRAADIWSMGVTLYCLVFGRLPFPYVNPVVLSEAISREG
ncbi:kinase-like domain-containing protein [Lipomyces kononenkoae]|uniref:Kinase-like domain-containing protein n=1 Tax=Lipomyces kononenkoae TaxID=34357 RepID=A0ACC3T069_LIPKO